MLATEPFFDEETFLYEDEDDWNAILIISSDKKAFKFRKLYLRAASATLDDAFLIGEGNDSREKSSDGFDILRLTEEGVLVQNLLWLPHSRMSAKITDLQTLKN